MEAERNRILIILKYWKTGHEYISIADYEKFLTLMLLNFISSNLNSVMLMQNILELLIWIMPSDVRWLNMVQIIFPRTSIEYSIHDP